MKIYLVRHGESEGNVGNIMQHNDEFLTEKGQKQAEFLGERLKKLPIEHIIASTSNRAKQTAEIINETLQKSIEFTDLLIERQLPSSFLNKAKDDPQILEERKMVWDRTGEPGWKHSDEENFEDITKRAFACLDLFLQSGKEEILVVTHGLFMLSILACAIMGKDITPDEYKRFVSCFLTYNTGVSVLMHKESFFEGHKPLRWLVYSWNDLVHLENSE